MRAIILSLAAGCFLLPSIANAQQDWWVQSATYPGLMCQAVDDPRDVARAEHGGLENATNTQVDVVCPIVRQNPTQAPLQVRVVVHDRHNNQNVTCRLFARRPGGQAVDFLQEQTRNNQGVIQTLTFGTLQNQDEGTYFLGCRLPAQTGQGRSGVASYTVRELRF